MLNKTKAALQSRLCRTDLCQLDYQDITVIDLVNSEAGNPASETVIPVSMNPAANSGEALRVTQSHAQPKQPIIWAVLNFYPAGVKIPSFIGGWDSQPPFEIIEEFNKLGYFSLSRFSILWQTEVSWSFRYLLHVAGGAVMNFTVRKITTMMMIRYINLRIDHPFGSMPRCASSLRMMRFIQAAKDSSPSSCWAFSIINLNSGSKRNWNGGLPRLSLLCVDTSITPDVMCLCVITHYTQEIEKATPRSASTLPRRLTEPLSEVTTMAKTHSNQTRTKYQYRFLALCRADMHAKPCRLSVEAETEQDARRVLAPHFILSLAARLPIQGVKHA